MSLWPVKISGHLSIEKETILLEGLGVRSQGRGVIGTDEMCLLNDALNQWFPTGGGFVPSRDHFAKSRDSLDHHHWAWGVLLVLVDGDQGYCQRY